LQTKQKYDETIITRHTSVQSFSLSYLCPHPTHFTPDPRMALLSSTMSKTTRPRLNIHEMASKRSLARDIRIGLKVQQKKSELFVHPPLIAALSVRYWFLSVHSWFGIVYLLITLPHPVPL